MSREQQYTLINDMCDSEVGISMLGLMSPRAYRLPQGRRGHVTPHIAVETVKCWWLLKNRTKCVGRQLCCQH